MEELTVGGKPFEFSAKTRLLDFLKKSKSGELFTSDEVMRLSGATSSPLSNWSKNGSLKDFCEKYDGKWFYGSPTTIKTFRKRLNEASK